MEYVDTSRRKSPRPGGRGKRGGMLRGLTPSRLGTRLGLLVVYLMLLATTAVVAYPLVMLFIGSFKSQFEFYTNPLGLPDSWAPDNFGVAKDNIPYFTLFGNSILVTAGSILILLACASALAFALSNFKFRGRNGLYLLFILMLVVPLTTAFIPQYVEIVKLHLDNTRTALMLIYAAGGMPLAVVLLRTFFDTIPGELIDASRIDGCNHFASFWRIVLPIAKPGLATVVIIQFLASWNDFFYPLIILHDPDKFTIALGMQNLIANSLNTSGNSAYSSFGVILAALTIAIVPIIVVYTIMQRQFISGLTAGALKG
jgi:raffinose/stachyose/melibiose transport system permease protein